MIRLRIVLAALAFCGSGHAEDEDGRYAVKGAGLMPCSTFSAELKAQSEKARTALAWIAGYFTATNANSAETFDIVSWQSEGMIAQALQARCDANPDEPLAKAIEAMVSTMRTDRIEGEERPVTIKVGSRERLLYPSVIRRMQTALSKPGNGVSITGKFDRSTEKALREFQASAKLAPTGFPDSVTLFRLLQSDAN